MLSTSLNFTKSCLLYTCNMLFNGANIHDITKYIRFDFIRFINKYCK